MKTLRSSSFFLVLFLILGAYSENKNSLKAPPLKIAPDSQTISLSITDRAIFEVINLGGCESVRIETKTLMGFDAWSTIPGYSNIVTPGIYNIPVPQIFGILGLGIFIWRITDNNNPWYSSETKLLIIIN